MRCCSQCGGALRRIHRSFWERFAYLAIYECRDCKEINCVQRPYRHHFGEWCRCPHCGTVRVSRLRSRDKIDPMYSGLVNSVKKLVGGGLHHCKFCRVQFYDRRPLAPDHQVTLPASKYATAQEE
jgi:transcription elongation factor Elf1